MKQGVNINNISPQICIAYTIATAIFERDGYACIITSANDGTHGADTLHYRGHAIDLRSKHIIHVADKKRFLADLKKALPGFDVLLENLGMANEHFHIEYDPTVPIVGGIKKP